MTGRAGGAGRARSTETITDRLNSASGPDPRWAGRAEAAGGVENELSVAERYAIVHAAVSDVILVVLEDVS